jgi:serine/threonine protein kinase
MGIVYKALDTKLNRYVALKVLPAHLTADPERRLRFQREAQATAALQHPNIAVIFEVGEHEGTPFIAMEHVEGQTLRERLEQGSFQMRDWLRVAVAIAEGVAHAHAGGVVHRDLKPDNVLLTPDRQVKILDFGLAKLLDLETLPEESDRDVHTRMNTVSGELTRAGQVFGTAAYMSPEQARGDSVDHRSDIFSLGVILYECASGKRPFSGDSHVETQDARKGPGAPLPTRGRAGHRSAQPATRSRQRPYDLTHNRGVRRRATPTVTDPDRRGTRRARGAHRGLGMVVATRRGDGHRGNDVGRTGGGHCRRRHREPQRPRGLRSPWAHVDGADHDRPRRKRRPLRGVDAEGPVGATSGRRQRRRSV